MAVECDTAPAPPFPGYDWKPKGVVEQVGSLSVYVTGAGPRCVVWCCDSWGPAGGRTTQLCDELGDRGYLVLLPDWARGEWPGAEPAPPAWLAQQADWAGQRQAEWVEQLLPYARAQGATAVGCVGTGWGAYLTARLSSYSEIRAGVSLHPTTTAVAAARSEQLYEVGVAAGRAGGRTAAGPGRGGLPSAGPHSRGQSRKRQAGRPHAEGLGVSKIPYLPSN